jgi:predicted SAM-dependent methyltransferase
MVGRKLNLGCGLNWKELYPHYLGLDIIDYGQAYVGDVIKVLPTIEDNAFDEVMANHFLEHFSQDEIKKIFKLVYRILKPEGIFRIVVPQLGKERAWILSHKTFWNETTVRWLAEREADIIYGFGKWKVDEILVNSRKDIHAMLRKIK